MTYKNLDMDYFKKIAERVNREKTLEKKVESPIKPISKEQKPIIEPVSPIVPPVSPKIPYWTIPNVLYHGTYGEVEVSTTFLDNGDCKDQNKWLDYSRQAKEKGEFYTPDYPLFYATAKAAFDLREDNSKKQQIEDIRSGIKDLVTSNYLHTLTMIKYAPKLKLFSDDLVIHNFGMLNYFELKDWIVGKNELIDSKSVVPYKSLFDTSDQFKELNQSFKWLFGSNIFIRRLEEKPKVRIESPAGLNISSRGLEFDLNTNLAGTARSMGFRFKSYPGVTP